ncbi:MFS transporter [Limibacter armeniacum]|uniref:MFS transporter n=1 Tax=Limibacter armeniacum TaxID=466084 RepID=UPI002FE5B252
MELNNKKVLNAWCSYDWANSVYSLVITSTIFPIYYNVSTREAFNGDRVEFFGFSIENTVLFSYSIAFSFLLIASLSPLLSGMADTGGVKKRMLQIFVLIGSLSCLGLFFFHGANIEYGIILSVLASIGYAGSLVFYNAYLPEIATEDRYDVLSAKGFSMGYIGSVIHLIVCFAFIEFPDIIGIDKDLAVRLSFLTVGVWWLGFAQIALYYLPSDSKDKKRRNYKLISRGYEELRKVFSSLKYHKPIKRFLVSFFFYNMGVQTVMLLAANFGEKELHLSSVKLIVTVLLLQIVAIAGAYFFAWLSKKIGNKSAIAIMIFSWVLICIGAFYTYTEMQFYTLAVAVGLVMGGIQSLSRSTYSKLIPDGTIDTTSYFSFYDVADKLSVVIGTFSFGLMEYLYGSMRYSALSLGVFFIIGLIAIFRFKMPLSNKSAVDQKLEITKS